MNRRKIIKKYGKARLKKALDYFESQNRHFTIQILINKLDELCINN